MYYADTATQRVDVFEFHPGTGAMAGRRPFAHIAATDGAPDGLTVDAEGGIRAAMWGGSEVRRYSPEGTLDARIRLPVSQVTACTFGGPHLRDLYITTSREGLPDGAEPAAGALFRPPPARPDFRPTGSEGEVRALNSSGAKEVRKRPGWEAR